MTDYLSTARSGIKLIGLLLFTVATSFYVYGQDPTEDEKLDDLLDELFFSEEEFMDELVDSFRGQNFLYANATYQSNTFFSGREFGVDQLSLIPQISFYHKSGFNASISGVYFGEFEPHWDVTNLTLGYYNTFGKNKTVHYSGGYSRYFYNIGNASFTNSIDLEIGLRTKNRTLGTELSAAYLFGDDQSFQLISSSYGKLVITKQKNFVLQFRPKINFIVAQQTIALEQLTIQGDQAFIEFVNFDVFDLLNTQINLPVIFTTRSWDFEIGYTFNLPNPVATESNLNATGFLNLSAGYLFDLD